VSAADLARELAALNAAIKKSHEALADMRAERKLLAQLLADIRAEIKDGVRALVDAEVEKQIAVLSVETDEAIRQTVKKINTIFDNYIAECLGTDPQSAREGKTPVPDIVRKARSMGMADTNAVGEYLARVQQLPD
jgi:hypothetical protein